jgi:hypothetical protein
MAQSGQVPSQDQVDAFIVRVLRYLDDDCSADEVRQLREALAQSATYRRWFVQVCRLQGDLYETYAPQRAAQEAKVANVAEPARMSALVGQLAGARTEGTPDVAAASTDFTLEPQIPEDSAVKNAPADTMHSELSGEDTIHRKPKTTGS